MLRIYTNSFYNVQVGSDYVFDGLLNCVPPPPPEPLPIGNVDGATCPRWLAGWAVDEDSPSTSLLVDVYKDGDKATGVSMGLYVANVNSSDVPYPGNHRFLIDLASSDDGSAHTFYVYALDIGPGGAARPGSALLSGSPATMAPCPPKPVPAEYDNCFGARAQDFGSNSRTLVNTPDAATQYGSQYDIPAVYATDYGPSQYAYTYNQDSPINNNPPPQNDAYGNGSLGYNRPTDVTWQYKPSRPTLTYNKVRQAWTYHVQQYTRAVVPTDVYDSNGVYLYTYYTYYYDYATWYSWDTYSSISNTHTCFAGTCTIDSVSNAKSNWLSPRPSTDVKADTPYTVTATITNTGEENLFENIYGSHLGLTGTGGDHPVGVTVYQRTSRVVMFDVQAPHTAQYIPLSFYPNYPGWYAVGPICNGPTVTVYEHFALTMDASVALVPDEENPSAVDWKTNVYSDAPSRQVYAPTQRALLEQQQGVGPYITRASLVGGVYDPNKVPSPWNGSQPPNPPVRAGDRYCAQVKTDYTMGWVGMGGPTNVADTSIPGATPPPPTNCPHVHNKPYFKAYGSGVSAGGSVSCGPGGILAGWNNNSAPANNRGAGSQLSALATNGITGFASGRTGAAIPPYYLSFANRPTTIDPDNISPKLGGNFGGGGCLTPAKPTVTAVTLPGGSTVGATTLNPGENKTIYVNGNVYIAGNIIYGPGPWDLKINKVPSFVLVATGNIYISAGVTQLDGFYTSQKSGGKIYTCAAGVGNPISDFTQCHQQLTVHGSFVADNVNLLRTFGSLRDATFNENPFTGGPPARDCQNSPPTAQVCAAELFNFSPELYLASPDLERPSNGAIQYDAITNLPPVL